MNLSFTIPGKIKAKQSVKFTKSGFKYTPNGVKEYANWVRVCFYEKYPKHFPSIFFEKPLKVTIDVYFAIPKSFSKKKREQALNGDIFPTVKPDWDNSAKAICDALNGIAYPDDRQIVSGTVNKYYAEIDYVNVEIVELCK